MLNEELKIKITEMLASASFDEAGEWLNISITPAEWPGFAQRLRDTAGLEFNFLFCVTGVDWKTHLGMVYHLTSTIHRHNIVVKAKLDRENPKLKP
jgi:NADH:ubiquinone oxidoreductase subunit C